MAFERSSRGGFAISLLVVVAGLAALTVGRFFFLERYRLYGCRPDDTPIVSIRRCPLKWQTSATADLSTILCIATGVLLTSVGSFVYPLARAASHRGKEEEAEEVRSALQVLSARRRVVRREDADAAATTSATTLEDAVKITRRNALDEERIVLALLGLPTPHRKWLYDALHPGLAKTLSRRRFLRSFASCLWVRLFFAFREKKATVLAAVAIATLATTWCSVAVADAAAKSTEAASQANKATTSPETNEEKIKEQLGFKLKAMMEDKLDVQWERTKGEKEKEERRHQHRQANLSAAGKCAIGLASLFTFAVPLQASAALFFAVFLASNENPVGVAAGFAACLCLSRFVLGFAYLLAFRTVAADGAFVATQLKKVEEDTERVRQLTKTLLVVF